MPNMIALFPLIKEKGGSVHVAFKIANKNTSAMEAQLLATPRCDQERAFVTESVIFETPEQVGCKACLESILFSVDVTIEE